MRLVTFSVENYRSISRARKIRLGRSTILVGPNNEGKSNILRALVAGMSILTEQRRPRALGYQSHAARPFSRRIYDWERDFPAHLQPKRPTGQSILTLEFELNGDELQDFQDAIKSKLNGALPVRISLGPESYKVTVHKQGPGAKALSAKSARIASFVAERLDFDYIPAIRTARDAEEIVSEMVARELRKLEGEEEYQQALSEVARIQQPMLEALSKTVTDTLVKFLPTIKGVQVQIPEANRYRALRRSCEIVVDDGTPTLLEHKGDGVQSLAALGIMRYASERGAAGRNMVIAVEEPESHLHPKAIHEFREVLFALSARHQVIVTTHNPLFVDRVNLRSNIIVEHSRAVAATSVERIREVLGVRAADNLRHAELVLVVEGEEDRRALGALLRAHSKALGSALDSGSLAIDAIGGAGNLSYKLGLLRDSLCLWHCFLDADKAGQRAFEVAELDGLISPASAHFTTCDGKLEAEIEDLYDPDLYSIPLKNRFGISLAHPRFKTAKKWSERVRETFKGQGKHWNDGVEAQVKSVVAEAVALSPSSALLKERRGCFNALVVALEERLTEITSQRK